MSGFFIRVASAADVDVLIHHRRMMWWDMGRRDESLLRDMEIAAREYFASALVDGSYRGFLAVNSDQQVVGGGGVVISPWPGQLGSQIPQRAMILNMYVERDYRRRGVARRTGDGRPDRNRQPDSADRGGGNRRTPTRARLACRRRGDSG